MAIAAVLWVGAHEPLSRERHILEPFGCDIYDAPYHPFFC